MQFLSSCNLILICSKSKNYRIINRNNIASCIPYHIFDKLRCLDSWFCMKIDSISPIPRVMIFLRMYRVLIDYWLNRSIKNDRAQGKRIILKRVCCTAVDLECTDYLPGNNGHNVAITLILSVILSVLNNFATRCSIYSSTIDFMDFHHLNRVKRSPVWNPIRKFWTRNMNQ